MKRVQAGGLEIPSRELLGGGTGDSRAVSLVQLLWAARAPHFVWLLAESFDLRKHSEDDSEMLRRVFADIRKT